MSWRVIAKKDFQDAVRARSFLALTAVLLVIVGVITGGYVLFDEVSGGDPSTLGLIFFVANTLGLFVSLTAIISCYKSVAGERETGSIKLMLSQPHTRRDVVVGKIVGRSAVIAIPVVVALLVGAVAGTLFLGDVALWGTTAFIFVGLLFTLAYVSVMVGLSAAAETTYRASVFAIVFFLVLELFWDGILFAVVFVAGGFEFPELSAYPDWAFVLSQLPPSSAFVTALVATVPDAPQAAAGPGPAGDQLDAFYTTPWLGIVVLLFYLVVVPVVGYRRFESADL